MMTRRSVLQAGLGLAVAAMFAAEGCAAKEVSKDNPKQARAETPALRDPIYAALPLGSIKAAGWVKHQLELQRDGLTGHAEGLLPAITEDSAWLGGKGEDWEKGPYYVKGLLPLAYTLDDPAMKALASHWVEGILATGRPDGSFGPPSNDDWWPRMVAAYILRDYAEATGDPRPVALLTAYYKYMAKDIAARPLKDWGKARAGDQIDTIFWLYRRTGDAFLLPLADTLHQQAYDWRDIFTNNRFLDFGNDYQPKHNVNVPQALKMPAVYYQRSGLDVDSRAYYAGIENLRRDHGLSVGIESGTEHLAGRSTTQGIELCSIVERMLSDETALRIFGNAAIGDDIETLAFNALPAALSNNIHQHVYFTLPNNVTAPRGGLGYNQDYDDARTPAPRSGFPCCCYNFHMGWPKLVQNAWATAPNGGLALMTYVPSVVTAPVAGGAKATVTTVTNYPFGEEVTLQMAVDKPSRFPLSLRVPGWCSSAAILVNGKAEPKPKAGTFAVVSREWKTGDTVTVRLPMTARVIPGGVSRSVSVRRGPLVYSLKIAEDWKQVDAGPKPGFAAYTVTPASPWNYALMPDAGFTFHQDAMPANPFDQAVTPVSLTAKAKKLDQWKLIPSGRAAYDPPLSPVASAAPVETVTLVPFGSEMLRVTDFPTIGTLPAPKTTYTDAFAGGHADGWVQYGGGWQVKNAALSPVPNDGSGPPGVKAVQTETQFTDFVYDAQVAVGPQGNAGLLFRVSLPSIGPDSYQGYYVGLNAELGLVEIGKASEAWTSLSKAPLAIKADTPYPVRVRAIGPHLQVFVSDMTKPLLDITDATHASGAIGVRHYYPDSHKISAAFSKVSVAAV